MHTIEIPTMLSVLLLAGTLVSTCRWRSLDRMRVSVCGHKNSLIGYLLAMRDGPRVLPDVDNSWDVAVAVAAFSRKVFEYWEMHAFPKMGKSKFPEMLICQN